MDLGSLRKSYRGDDEVSMPGGHPEPFPRCFSLQALGKMGQGQGAPGDAWSAWLQVHWEMPLPTLGMDSQGALDGPGRVRACRWEGGPEVPANEEEWTGKLNWPRSKLR